MPASMPRESTSMSGIESQSPVMPKLTLRLYDRIATPVRTPWLTGTNGKYSSISRPHA